MDDVAEGVLAFIQWTDRHPLPAEVPTCDVLGALRARLDACAPGWRDRAFADGGAHRVEVEVRLSDGRVVRGALAQRSSAVRGEAA